MHQVIDMESSSQKLTSFSSRLYEIQSSCSVSATPSSASSFFIWLRPKERTLSLGRLLRPANFSMLFVDRDNFLQLEVVALSYDERLTMHCQQGGLGNKVLLTRSSSARQGLHPSYRWVEFVPSDPPALQVSIWLSLSTS